MRNIFLLFFLLIVINSKAQISFIGFDTTICGSPLTISYTYTNYDIGSHGHGYRIYKNGILIYDKQNSGPLFCRELIFINDSIGFIAEANLGVGSIPSISVFKTSDFGLYWANVGNSAEYGYSIGLFIVNANYGYLVAPNFGNVLVSTISDIQTPSNIIYDSLVNADIYKTDSILYNPLCNIDSLKIFILNNTDTITYHINFDFHISVFAIDKENKNQAIFPCPATDHFSLSNDIKEISSVSLVNVNGQTIINFSKKSILENYFILPKMANGIYFISTIQRRQAKHFKIEINSSR